MGDLIGFAALVALLLYPSLAVLLIALYLLWEYKH